MLNNEAQAAQIVRMIDPVSAANTAAATSAWIDVRSYEGDLACIQLVGAVTGSIVGKIQDATDGSGTGAADVTGATFASASGGNAQEIAVSANAVRGWIRYVGTITTGPALVGASFMGRPKIV